MRTRFTLLAMLGPALGWAHPMGNFSVSHYARLEASAGGVHLTYALDLAEIPTFELLREWKLDASSPRAELEARARRQAEEWAANLMLRVDGAQVAPVVESSELAVAEGAGALPVVRITARLRVPGAAGRVEYEDRNYQDRAGWKEIVVAAGDGALLRTTSHPAGDRSRALSAYPADPSIAPPQDLRAVFEWAAPTPALAAGPAPVPKAPVIVPVKQPEPPMVEARPAARASAGGAAPAGTVTKGDYLSALLRRGDLGPGVILLGLCAAFGLGALHALSPGHGKTIVAAYLVGARGTFRHALLLGATVTFTHTVSVFLLGLATLFLSAYVVPEKVYPVLGAISGLSIIAIGASLFWKRLRRLRGANGHHHHHHHDHAHGHGHHHPQHHHHHEVPEQVTMAGLIALGASGGLAPCPSALVLLLSAIALGRTGLGMLLLTGFSLGLALVLMGIGCLVLYAKHLLPEPAAAARSPFFRFAPVLSAALITLIGALMTGVSLGWVKPMLF